MAESSSSMDFADIVASTAEPAFAVDDDHKVVAWNRAAERLLGYAAERIVGSSCHLVMCGRDIFGNRFCDETCAVLNMARRREPIGGFELDVRTASGEALRVRMAAVVVPGAGPGPGQRLIVHLFHPVESGGRGERAAAPATGGRAPRATLSGRELEVLGHIAEGKTTREVAEALSISPATVRNHIQNVLRKLEVHSKVEAVSLALRIGLL